MQEGGSTVYAMRCDPNACRALNFACAALPIYHVGVQQSATLRKAMGVRMSDGAPLFDCVQATWNLLEQSAGEWAARLGG